MRFLLTAAAFVAVFGSSAQADCSMKQVVASPVSVLEPCTARLNVPGLSDLDRAQVYLVRARAYHRLQRYEEGAEDYRSSVKLDPYNAETHVSWSNLEFGRRNWRDYGDLLRKAYLLNPDNARVLRAVGWARQNSGDRDAAIEFYTKAIAADPNEGFARYYRADAHRRGRRFPQALADVNDLLRISPEILNEQGFIERGIVRDFHVMALLKRALIHKETGQLDLAAKDYDAAVERGRSVPALIARAEFLQLVPERRGEALGNLVEAVKQEPKNPEANYELGYELLKIGRKEDAFFAFDTAARWPGYKAAALMMRAKIHREFGRTDDALRDLHEAMADDKRQFDHMIHVLRRAGYWTAPNVPKVMTAELEDAFRACMVDTKCN